MKKILRFASWAEKNWLKLIVFLLLLMMVFICIVMFSWLWGYWSNALHGTKFEIASCWNGIAAVIAGMGGIAALAKAAWTKYSADSQYNSPAGIMPHGIDKEDKKC
jgi:hypothetical protein